MDLLDYPEAKALLADATVDADAVRSCAGRLEAFVRRYLPCFRYREQHAHFSTVLRGKLGGLQRKTTEPIATEAGLQRRPLQLFVGAGGWDDTAVRAELQRHVADELGDPEGVFILDNSSYAKKGEHSCGVARQWCGRLGKLENCQVGAYLAYSAPRGKTLLSGRLYLPAEWAEDPKRRVETHVPAEVVFAEKWRLGLELLDAARVRVPGRWVVGDDEFGRCTELRAALRQRKLNYVLDVPSNTLVRDVAERRPATRPGGRLRLPEFERADQWLARQPAGRWRTIKLRDGEKGPRRVKVLLATVQTKDEDGATGPSERLVAIRTCEAKPRTSYALSNAREATRPVLAKVQGQRHGVEELFEQGNGEVGLSHYEVRSWVGWHHHVTLTLLALWFLQMEKLRLGKKNTRGDSAASPGDLHGTVAFAGENAGADRGGGEPSAAA